MSKRRVQETKIVKTSNNSLKDEQIALDNLVKVIGTANNRGNYWLNLENASIIFNLKLVAIYPNFFNKEIHIEQASIRKFVNSKVIQSYGGFSGFSLMDINGCKNGFLTDCLSKTYYRNQGFQITEHIVVRDNDGRNVLFDGKSVTMFKTNNPAGKNAMYIPMRYINRSLGDNWNALKVAIEMLKNGLLPKVYISNYQDLVTLFAEYKDGRRSVDENGNVTEVIETVDEKADVVFSKEQKKVVGDNNKNDKKDNNSSLNQEQKKIVSDNNKSSLTPQEKELLECDKVRFSYMAYDRDKLYDLSNGHWDLFDADVAQERNTYKNKEGFVARNPILDVQKNGVVAIDFGTKSTVVVYRNGSTMKIPLRIGTNSFKKDVTDDQYENPTIEEFINLKEFMSAYKEKNGRPNTKWKDLIIANQAQKDMIDNSMVLEYHYSYFSDIKQWAAGQTEAIVSDQQGFEPIIKNYMNESSQIDLVEVYAYFIGLHINNMNNGIFLNYKLSFPVSFDIDMREKIRTSFERGIKKSIPEIVQNDMKIFKKFKVRLVASEPASYAACAIQQYKIDVPEDEAIFYGIFDFGGGTSDFDFGLWKECDDEESSYTYELHRITSVGDPYLGGENLLEMLAYEVVKTNVKELKDKEIAFVRPKFCDRFKVDELVIAEPQTRIARRNTSIVKEKLRSFWQGDYKEINEQKNIQTNKIEVDLMSRNGKIENSIALDVNYYELYNLLKTRIKEGVSKFEEGRKKALNSLTNLQKIAWLPKPQYIFLAGNSCKSSIVQDVLNEQYKEEIANKEIKIYQPLKSTRDTESSQLFTPNGKTGVAWGLLDIGDSVKFVDNELAIKEKIEFKFCVGINKKNKLLSKITPNCEYGKWMKLVKADKEEITIYYTDNIIAANSDFSIEEADNFIYEIDEPDSDKYVFIRMIDSTTIEITHATEEDIDYENQISIVKGDTILEKEGAYQIVTYDLKQMK